MEFCERDEAVFHEKLNEVRRDWGGRGLRKMASRDQDKRDDIFEILIF